MSTTSLNNKSDRSVPVSDKTEISLSEFALFRQWLYAEAGIQLADAKQALVAGRLAKRLRELGMSSYRQYYEYLQSAASHSVNSGAQQDERQVALDLLTTNETYFLREKAHFDFLKQTVLPRWRQRSLHCWSAASSSGEEAYTLAMLLADNHSADWRITGTDLSSRVVSQAQQAIYPMSRATNIPRHWLQNYCLKGIDDKAGTFRISSLVRRQVNFRQANLQQPQSSIGPFDVIFLRNVMIYFDTASKKRVLANVLDRLKPDGFLLVGHAESLNGLSDRIHLVKPSIYQLLDVR